MFEVTVSYNNVMVKFGGYVGNVANFTGIFSNFLSNVLL